MEANNLKILVRGAYDIQKLRIQMGNRIAANLRAKYEDAKEKPEEVLKKARKEFSTITHNLQKFPSQSKFKGEGVISTYTELCLVAQYVDLEQHESTHFRKMEKVLEEYPVYTEYLKGVKGIGPAMAGVIVSEIDIHKAEYPSSLWMYAGLDVAPDGKGRSRRKEHLVEVEYETREGKKDTKKSITFNPFLKTKLTGVLGASFLRAGDNPYKEIYYNYKHRLEHHEDHKEKTKGHRHNMAIRYMIKMFLIDLHKTWRALEGLPVSESYCEAKLGKIHKVA